MDYQLYDNHFTPENPDDRLARPVNVRINTREDLVKDMSGPGEILKPTEINAVIDRMWKQLMDYVCKGEGYQDEYLAFRYDIKGVFQGDDDAFDHKRHTLQLSLILKKMVTNVLKLVSMKKAGTAQGVRPVIQRVYDWGSDSTNQQLTPGDGVEVSGTHLKVYDHVSESGVYLLNLASQEEIKIEELRTNEPKTLTFRVPELAPGRYQLVIRNTRHDSKALREGILLKDLVVS